ncbi:MAG TPA: NAD(P)-dependent alcohol dehydrogenase [Xanthobacteraceae bacterium]|nr:NAD(P)-dependent alcohol dehydrogenase [Xanthobacteraceae bacterium]
MQITAAVVREKSGPFSIERLELDEPRGNEVAVRIVASGMCHTDLHGRDGYYGTPFPAVFGHEGAGTVLAVGPEVRTLSPGDHVIVSFPWCGHCPSCAAHVPAHCLHQWELKMRGTRPDGSTLMRMGDAPVYSAFFQQSSFGTVAISQEPWVVKVRADAPLDRLGPFACGIQTGAGAVLNAVRPQAGESLAVFGTGGVGLSALMAAKLAGCDPLIAVDIRPKRLALARELGATHAIDATATPDIVGEIRKLTRYGVRHAIDTTAVPAMFRQAVDALMPLGTCILLGSARPGVEAAFEMVKLQEGRGIRGVIQGWSEPKSFLPKLVDLMMEGKLPVERLMTWYDLADINRAADDAAKGTTIKPVLRMPQ